MPIFLGNVNIDGENASLHPIYGSLKGAWLQIFFRFTGLQLVDPFDCLSCLRATTGSSDMGPSSEPFLFCLGD